MSGDSAFAVKRTIASKIKKHCKRHWAKAGTTTEDYRADAREIFNANRLFVQRQRAWRPEDEIARIEKIERGLNQAINELHSLPEPLRLVLVLDTKPTNATPQEILAALEEIRSAAAPGIKSAKEEAERGVVSKSDPRARSVLRACRDVWKHRDRRRVPRTAHQSASGPFPSFVADVFDVLNINISVRSALDAVNKQ